MKGMKIVGMVCRWIFVLLVAIMVLMPSFIMQYMGTNKIDGMGTTTIMSTSELADGKRSIYTEIPPANWTVILYFAGDNSLSDAANEDYNEILTGGVNTNINVILLIDRSGYGDTECRYIATDMNTVVPLNEIDPEWTENELNMADGDTLAKFVEWSMRNSYSRYYALVLWDHGGGWEDGVCQDGWDWLEIDELSRAIDTATKAVGRPLDLIGFDACLMGQVEVFYQLKQYANYFVGSAEIEPWDGWDYQRIFSNFYANNSPEDFGRLIVDTYVESYTDGQPDPNDYDEVTMVLVNNTLEDGVVGFDHTLIGRINHLAQYLIRGVREYQYQNINPVKSAYSNTKRYYVGDYGDLYNFAYNLVTEQYPQIDINGPNIRQYASLVLDAMNRSVYFRGGQGVGSHVKGLSIYLTATYTILDGKGSHRLASYDETAFALETKWDEFINEYSNPQTTGIYNSIPTCEISIAEYSTGSVHIAGTATDDLVDTNTITGVDVKIDAGPWLPATLSQGANPQEYTWSFDYNIELPNGIHYVYARAYDDWDYSYYAVDDPNAPWSTEFTVSTELPDLSVAMSPEIGIMDEGEELKTNISVYNIGETWADNIDVKIYIDNEVYKYYRIETLNPMSSYDIPISVILTAGKHTIKAVVDPSRNITEVDEDNNFYYHEVSVLGYGLSVDLPMGSEIYVTAGEPTLLWVDITNAGTKTANYTMVSEMPEGWSFTGENHIGPLDPGVNVRIEVSITPPTSVYIGEEDYILFNISCDEKVSVYEIVSVKATVVAFYDNIDGDTSSWSVANVGTGSGWHITQEGYGGTNGWYCGNDLTGEYESNTDTYLYTPEIDLTGMVDAILIFDHKYDAEISYDGGCVYVYLNGSHEIIYPTNGYPATGINALENGDGYSGNSNGWVTAEFPLNDYLGKKIKIAFRFASDDTINYGGWYLDNIVVKGRINAHDVGVDNISFSGNMVPFSTVNISVVVANYGIFPETFKTNLMVSYSNVDLNLGNITVNNLLPAQTRTLYWEYIPETEGYYTFTARTMLLDDENPTNDVMSKDLGIFIYAPVIYIDSPEEGATVDGIVVVMGRASDPNGNVQSVEVAIDNGTWTLAQDTSGNGSWATWQYLWDTTNYSNGTHIIHARAYDGAYYSEVVNRTVVVSHMGINHPPVAIISSPIEGTYYDYGTEIYFDGSQSYDPDNEPLVYRWESNITGLLSTEPVFYRTLPSGHHKITLRVEDAEGLYSIAIVNITVNESVQNVIFHDDMETMHSWWYPWPQSKWEWGTPQNTTGGPQVTYSGDKCWGTNLSGYYDNMVDWNLTLSIDLTTVTNDTGLLLTVYMWYDTESGYDGCVVYGSSDNATWTQLIPREGYDGTISSSFNSPIAGLEAFTGSSEGWIKRTFDITAYKGHPLYLLFRLASDTSVSDYFGWYIDDIYINSTSGVENLPPVAVISSPDNNSVFDATQEIYFDGTESYDPDGYIINYQWVSDIDGPLSTDAAFTQQLSPGNHTITLTVTDDLNAQSTATIQITVLTGENNPPMAIISSPQEGDIYEVGDSVVFDATDSYDPDGDTLEFEWYSSIDGLIGTEQHFVKSDLSEGTHRITLKIRDSGGLEDEAYVNITVKPKEPNISPVIDDTYPLTTTIYIKEGETVRFSANASDDNKNDTLAAVWYIDNINAKDYTHGTISTSSTPEIDENYHPSIYTWLEWTPDYTTQGTHTITLKISDIETSVYHNWTLEIENVNLPPVAVISSPHEGEEYYTDDNITFDASLSTDPDGDTLMYVWSSSLSGILSSEKTFTTKLIKGTHVISLTVKDPYGLENTTSVTITVKERIGPGPPQPQEGIFYVECGDNRTVNVNTTVSFNATQSYDSFSDKNGNGIIDWDEGEGTDIIFEWDFGDGTEAKGREVSHKYTTPGEYRVVLKGINGSGAVAYDNVTITVNAKPVAVLSIPSAYWAPNVMLVVDASASYDPEGYIKSYVFDFGDNTGEIETSSPTATHTYATEGIYVITLKVVDNYGLEATTSKIINIIKGGIPAPIITTPTEGEKVEGRVTIEGKTSGENVMVVEVAILDSEGNIAVNFDTAIDTSVDGNWATWQYEWDTREVNDGEYTIKVRVTSKVGNFIAESQLNVTVANGKGPEKEVGGEEKKGDIISTLNEGLGTLEGKLCAVVVLLFIVLVAVGIYTSRPEAEEGLATPTEESREGGEGEVLVAEVVEEEEQPEEELGDELKGAAVTLYITCPKCGAEIEFEKGAEYIVCDECGAKGRVRYSLEDEDKDKQSKGGEDKEGGKEAGNKPKKRIKRKVSKRSKSQEEEDMDTTVSGDIGGDMIRTI